MNRWTVSAALIFLAGLVVSLRPGPVAEDAHAIRTDAGAVDVDRGRRSRDGSAAPNGSASTRQAQVDLAAVVSARRLGGAGLDGRDPFGWIVRPPPPAPAPPAPVAVEVHTSEPDIPTQTTRPAPVPSTLAARPRARPARASRTPTPALDARLTGRIVENGQESLWLGVGSRTVEARVGEVLSPAHRIADVGERRVTIARREGAIVDVVRWPASDGKIELR